MIVHESNLSWQCSLSAAKRPAQSGRRAFRWLNAQRRARGNRHANRSLEKLGMIGVSLLASWLVFAVSATVTAQQLGRAGDVNVAQPTRIDWVFALSNQSPAEPPADWLTDYDSSAQTYELYVPKSLKPSVAPGLVLFISPGDRATGLSAFRDVCDANNLIFASPHRAGNNTDTRRRVRIVLDVLDDLRRRYAVDPDRTYIGGFSGGGRIACAIGFSLPEYFGGVLPVCAAGELREEPWLRQRVRDRLSVAHLTGDGDFNRGEVERFRGPMLASVGVRSKVWVVAKTGHAIPGAAAVKEAVTWLEESLPQRRQFAKTYPASRIAADDDAAREQWARRLLDEGRGRLAAPATTYSGLMQIKGVLERWPDVKAANEAKTLLVKAEQGADRTWEDEDIAEQRRFLIARAKSLSDYALGPLPDQYAGQRPAMIKAATQLWKLVIEDGQDQAAVAEGRRQMTKLAEAAADSGQ